MSGPVVCTPNKPHVRYYAVDSTRPSPTKQCTSTMLRQNTIATANPSKRHLIPRQESEHTDRTPVQTTIGQARKDSEMVTYPVLHQQVFDDDLCDGVLHLGAKHARAQVGQVPQRHNGRDVIGRVGVQRSMHVLSAGNRQHSHHS